MMGRRSVKENKSVYQMIREDLGLTREKAGDLIDGMSAEKIEKIENDRVALYPDDVLLMAEGYKAPQLCNYYCSHECPIGIDRIPETEFKSISQIAVETINCANRLKKNEEYLLEIVEDEKLSEDEYTKFAEIKTTIDKLARSAAELQLWIDKKIADGQVDKDILREKSGGN